MQDHLTFDHLQFGATVYGGSETHGTSNGIVFQNCTIAPAAGNQALGETAFAGAGATKDKREFCHIRHSKNHAGNRPPD